MKRLQIWSSSSSESSITIQRRKLFYCRVRLVCSRRFCTILAQRWNNWWNQLRILNNSLLSIAFPIMARRANKWEGKYLIVFYRLMWILICLMGRKLTAVDILLEGEIILDYHILWINRFSSNCLFFNSFNMTYTNELIDVRLHAVISEMVYLEI